MKTKSPFRKIIKWQFLLLAIILGIILILGGFIYYRYEERTIRDEKYNELKVIADLKISQITEWRDERLADVHVFAESPFIQQNIQHWLLSRDIIIKKDLLKRISLIRFHYKYENVFIVSPEGKLLLSLDTALKNIDSTTIRFCKNSVKDRKALFSDFYYCPTHKTIHLDIIDPISNEKNVPVAVLILRVNPYDYLYNLITYWPTPSKTSEVLIVRKDGDSILYVNELRHVSNTALKFRIPLTSTKIPAVEAVLGHVGIMEGIDYRGTKVLADIRPVSGTPWFMVAKVDKSEIFSELYYRLIIIIAFILLLIFLLIAALAWLYHSRQQNIYKQLLETGNALQESQEEFKTTLYSIGDAVITTDMNSLVHNMNPVAEKLTGWKESDAKNKELEKIFQIVNEETRNKVENPVHKILREGLVVSLANHTLLISKDGKEIPIADSGAPIKGSDGKIMGVVLVFRDQTNERNAEQRLRESEEKFRNVFDNSVVGKSITQIDGKLKTNKAFCHILGYTNDELLHLKWQEITHKDDIENDQKIINSIINGEKAAAHWEKRYIHKNGNIVWVDISTSLQCDNEGKPLYFITAIIDITERKCAEDAMRQSRKELDNLFEASPEMLSFIGFDGYFKRLNPAWVKTLGFPVDKLLSIPFIEFVHPDDREATNAEAAKLAGGQRTIQFDNRYRCNDGSYRWLSWSVIPDTKEKLLYAVARDITERKLADQELREREARYRTLVENIPQKILMKDRNYKWVSINENLARDFGFRPEEVVGKVDSDLFSPELAAKYHSDDVRIMKTGKTEELEEKYIADGKETWVNTIKTPVRDLNGEIVGLLGIFWDITERKHTEETLIDSEKKLREVQEMAHLGFWGWDIKTGEVEWSDEVFKIFCLDPKEFKPQIDSILALSPWPEDNKRDQELINRAIETRSPGHYEQKFLRPDKSIGHYYSTFQGNFDEKGDLISIVGTVLDITERKLVEEELKTSESFLNNIINQSPYPMWISDDSGMLIRINQACLDLLHISEREVIGKYNILKDNIVEEQGFMPLVKSMFETGETVKFELRYDSSQLKHLQLAHFKFLILSVTIFPIRDAKGIISNAIIQHIDITEQKRAEEEIKKLNETLEQRVKERTAELKESEERFRQLAEASYEAIIIHEGGVLLRANDQYYDLFGFKPEEILGKQVMPLTTAPESLKVLQDQIASGGTGPYMAIGLRKDGTTFPMEIRARNMEYNGRNVRVAAILDISLRVQAEMELRNRTTALEIANRELEAFSYSVSHDLRAPLRHTSGYVELLSNRFKDVLPEKGQHYLHEISDSVHQMGSLIDDLLNFSRTGRLEMHKTVLDMNKIVEELSKQLQQDNPECKIKWVIGNLPAVLGDDLMMRLVWMNLLGNAVKFTSTRKKAIIEIGANIEGSETIFFVRDNGVGFDMQYAQKLFGVFQRMHPTEEFEGTGIGLANVKRTISRHGGRIWGEAKIDKGATFYFSLPKRQ